MGGINHQIIDGLLLLYYSSIRDGGHIRPYPNWVTFAPTSQTFPVNEPFDLLGFDLGTTDI